MSKTFTHNGRTYTEDTSGIIRDSLGNVVELFEGNYTRVLNANRTGWWRYHDHYDRDGYCDNPARGY